MTKKAQIEINKLFAEILADFSGFKRNNSETDTDLFLWELGLNHFLGTRFLTRPEGFILTGYWTKESVPPLSIGNALIPRIDEPINGEFGFDVSELWSDGGYIWRTSFLGKSIRENQSDLLGQLGLIRDDTDASIAVLSKSCGPLAETVYFNVLDACSQIKDHLIPYIKQIESEQDKDGGGMNREHGCPVRDTT